MPHIIVTVGILRYLLKQIFLNFDMSAYHMQSYKIQILIVWVWSGPEVLYFLTSSQMMLVLLTPDHTKSNQVLNDHHLDKGT